MCIIAVKKEGVKMPKDATIKKMFLSNKDGAGYMIKRKADDFVTINKGFMDVDSFLKSIRDEGIKDEDIVVMHFRIATIGGKVERLTHPFVANSDSKITESIKAKIYDDLCFAHNGTLSVFSSIASKEERSDSSVFGSMILSDSFFYNNVDSPMLKIMLNKYIGESNKLAVIRPDMHKVFLFGEWSDEDRKEYKWNEDKNTGMIYSNFTWETEQKLSFFGFNRTYLKEITRTTSSNVDGKLPFVTDDDDDDIQGSCMTVSHVSKKFNDDEEESEEDMLVELGAMKDYELSSFLDFHKFKKNVFIAKIKRRMISPAAFFVMYDTWCKWFYDFKKPANDDTDIKYKSGVIVTEEGMKELNNSKKKNNSKIGFCHCCGTDEETLKIANLKLIKSPNMRGVSICSMCISEYGDLYGVGKQETYS